MLKEITCPACRHTKYNLAESYKDYRILNCLSCGLFFCDPMRGGKKEFYKEHFVYRKTDTGTIKQHFDAAANKSNRHLLEMAGKAGRILDVGCGFGAFVKYSLDKGYDAYLKS